RSRLSALRALVAAALRYRLIGDPRVEAAIGQSLDGLAAAEEEIRGARIADRPAARAFVQFEDRAALSHRDDVLDDGRLGLDLGLEHMHRRQRGVAAHAWAGDPHHVLDAGFALPRHRGRCALGAAGQAEAMHLADHRVARYAAEFGRDPACG